MDNEEKKRTVEPDTEFTEGAKEKTESEEKRVLIRVPARHNPRQKQVGGFGIRILSGS